MGLVRLESRRCGRCPRASAPGAGATRCRLREGGVRRPRVGGPPWAAHGAGRTPAPGCAETRASRTAVHTPAAAPAARPECGDSQTPFRGHTADRACGTPTGAELSAGCGPTRHGTGAAWEKPVAAGRVRVPSRETPRTDAGGKRAGGGRAAAAVRTGSSGAKAFCGGWAAARSARADSGQTSQRAARGAEPRTAAEGRAVLRAPLGKHGHPGRSPLRPGTGPLGTGASVSRGLAEAGGAWRGRRVLGPSGFWVVGAEPPVAACVGPAHGPPGPGSHCTGGPRRQQGGQGCQ